MSAGLGPVVHLIAPAMLGGAESVVAALACGDVVGTRVVTLVRRGAGTDPHPLTERLARAGVVVEEIRINPRRYVEQSGQVSQILLRWNATLVHCHGLHGTIVGFAAARRAGIPVVVTAHGFVQSDLKSRLYGALESWVLRRCNAVIAVSDKLRDELRERGVIPERLFMVRNGLGASAVLGRDAARAELGLSSAGAVVGWVGRFSVEKGADLLIEAAAGLDQSTTVAFIGDGPERGALERMADAGRRRSDGPAIIFLGPRAEAARLLRAFDALVLSSRSEGTPMVVLEAAAAGVPVVAFGVGGVPEVVDDSVGWLVPAGDTGALGAAMRHALGAPDEAARRARAAEERVQRTLSLSAWLGQVRRVYDTVLGRINHRERVDG